MGAREWFLSLPEDEQQRVEDSGFTLEQYWAQRGEPPPVLGDSVTVAAEGAQPRAPIGRGARGRNALAAAPAATTPDPGTELRRTRGARGRNAYAPLDVLARAAESGAALDDEPEAAPKPNVPLEIEPATPPRQAPQSAPGRASGTARLGMPKQGLSLRQGGPALDAGPRAPVSPGMTAAAARMAPAAVSGAPQAGLLQRLAGAMQKPENVMMALQLAGGLGQGIMAGRAQDKAQKRTNQNQARANLVNAISRGRANQQGAQVQPGFGVGQTLMGTLSRAGQMGGEAIERGKEEKLKAAAEGRAERQLGLQGRQVDLEGERVGLEGRRVGMEGTRMEDARREFEANRTLRERELTQTGEYQRGMLGVSRQANQLRGEAAMAAAQARAQGKAQKLSADFQKRYMEAQTAYQLISDLEDTLNAAEGKGLPFMDALTAVPGLRRAFPKASTYQDMKGPVSLAIAAVFNRGRPSDPDRAAIESALPSVGDSDTMRELKIYRFKRMTRMSRDLLSRGLVVQGNVAQFMRPDGSFDEGRIYRSLQRLDEVGDEGEEEDGAAMNDEEDEDEGYDFQVPGLP